MIDFAAIVDTLEDEERFVPTIYKDSRGFDTVAIGICVDPRVPGAGFTRDEARVVTRMRAERIMVELAAAIPGFAGFRPAWQAALVLMAYQMGVGGVRSFRRMLNAMRADDAATAAREALDSDWHRRDSPARAARIAAMIEKG